MTISNARLTLPLPPQPIPLTPGGYIAPSEGGGDGAGGTGEGGGPMIHVMPSKVQSSAIVSDAPAQGADKELDRAQQVGRRLASELAAALAALPPEHRSIRSMATYLSIDANVSQRAIAASQLTSDPIEALRKAPGIAGLRLLHIALEKRGMKRSLLAALDAAVEQFAHLIQDAGGSHAKLQRRLMTAQEQVAHDDEPSDPSADEQLRRRMVQSTATWLGSHVEMHAGIVIARGVPDVPEFTEGGKIQAYLGHRSRMSGLPLVMTNRYRSGEPKNKQQTAEFSLTRESAAPAEGASLLPEFSSDPSPLVSTRADEHNSVYIVDPAASNNAPVDAVVFTHLPRVRHPRLCAKPMFTFYLPVEQPCRRMVYDVWLEKKLASGGIPSAGFGWVGEPLRNGEGLPWYHRLPSPAALEVLTRSTFRPSLGWARHGEATRRAFEMLGYEWGDFVGYRLEQTYPVWGSAAVMVMDYAAAVEADNAARNA